MTPDHPMSAPAINELRYSSDYVRAIDTVSRRAADVLRRHATTHAIRRGRTLVTAEDVADVLAESLRELADGGNVEIDAR